ncbi:hypothetical protein PsAD46_03351 [Pseudovibrio sp. Ad46]|nr:putative phage abortive infection protein [Pseudovibrio sp. Ad46]KZK85760.1 hypothetical protein PsAD46_03351 [Pseudovibrio sp. Ad46]KZK97927.1 hypothetical protein PsAD5_02166 [Pseudovibrio sp. Ad5]
MPKSEQPKDQRTKRNALLLSSPWAWIIFIGLTILIICLWWANARYAVTGELPYLLSYFDTPEPQPQSILERLGILGTPQAVGGYSERGPTGDTFGIVNSLFAGLAFLGLFYAILLQREELSTVKDERDDTREILEKQEDNITAQTKQLGKQAFETSFYNALDLLFKHREQLLHPGKTNIRGSAALARYVKDLRDKTTSALHVSNLLTGYWAAPRNEPRDGSVDYIRFVMMISEMIEKSEIDNKEIYREILRSQLLDSDLVLIFFAAFSKEVQSSAWRQLVIESNLLKYIALRDWTSDCKECIKEVYDGETMYL